MLKRPYLLDVNVLIALSDAGHADHKRTSLWFKQIGDHRFLLCPVTEAGFVRLSAAPHVGGRDMREAVALLRQIAALPNCAHLPIQESWLDLVHPFAARLHGYRQVTDALLLGLAVRHKCILVTLDRHIQDLADAGSRGSVLTLTR